MRLVALVLIAAGTLATWDASAQAPQDSAPSFEVASIKPRIGERALTVGPSSPDRFSRVDTTLLALINFAYDMRPYQIEGGPEWLSSARFDVSAKAPGAIRGSAQMRPLVRRLLEERFALKTHVETKERAVYELVLARRDGRLGPNLKSAVDDCEPFLTGQRPMQESPIDPESGMPRCSAGARLSSSGVITPRLNGQPLSALARYLEPMLGRRVIDKTGLTSKYDIELTYVEERLAPLPGAKPTEGPALFTALEEQLGLKLESARGPVDVLVIDRAEQPTPD